MTTDMQLSCASCNRCSTTVNPNRPSQLRNRYTVSGGGHTSWRSARSSCDAGFMARRTSSRRRVAGVALKRCISACSRRHSSIRPSIALSSSSILPAEKSSPELLVQPMLAAQLFRPDSKGVGQITLASVTACEAQCRGVQMLSASTVVTKHIRQHKMASRCDS